MAKLNIPVAKSGQTIEVDTEQLSVTMLQYLVSLGLKAVLARGMSDLTASKMPDEAARKAAAQAQAEKNLVDLYAGKTKMTGGVKPKGTSGAVNTEAMRLAKIAVKDMLKAAGHKISHYEASEITKAAKQLIEADPSYVEQAKVNIEERSKKPLPTVIDVKTIAVSAKKVADAEQKKKDDKLKRDAAKKDKPLSAKQAGQVAPRKAKPKPAAHA